MTISTPLLWEHWGRGAVIAENEAHLWWVDLSPVPTGRDWSGLLSVEEQARKERYRSEKDRRQFGTGRGVVRAILAEYLAVEPRLVPLQTAADGKPFVDLDDEPLRFNLSHSGTRMLVAVTRGREVGVDLEAIRMNVDFCGLAERLFPPGESWTVLSASGEERASRFFELWTKLEARLKCDGRGLAGEGTGDWRPFCERSFRPAPGYQGAIALAGVEEFELRCWQWQN